jgi:hypothetical protein
LGGRDRALIETNGTYEFDVPPVLATHDGAQALVTYGVPRVAGTESLPPDLAVRDRKPAPLLAELHLPTDI